MRHPLLHAAPATPLLRRIIGWPLRHQGVFPMSLGSEFKEFAMKGNVIDLAVGVVIGAAFGKIVAALVADIFMPPIGLIIGGINFSDLAVKLGVDPTGKPVLL